jgi:hypothetical protein
VDRWHAVKLLDRTRDRDVEILLILGRREAFAGHAAGERSAAAAPALAEPPDPSDRRRRSPFSSAELQRSLHAELDAALEQVLDRARHVAPEGTLKQPPKRMYELTPSDGRADDYLRWRRWRTRRLPAHVDPQPWRGMPAQRLLRAVRPDRTAARNLTTS